MKKLISVMFILAVVFSVSVAQPKIELVNKPADKKIDVLIGGKLFTSYIYPDNIKKPVLFWVAPWK